MAMPSFIGGIQYFKRKDNRGCDERIGFVVWKPLASNKVFLMKHLFNMNMLEGGYVADNLNEFNTVTNQLSYVEVNFDD